MPGARAASFPYLKIAGRRISMSVLALEGRQEPRLRFDRVASALIRRLQDSLATALPEGKVVVVTVTAPIRQSSKTAAALEVAIRALLGTRRNRWRAQIEGNGIEVRVMKGGGRGTSRLIGFVHNPQPDASLLFDVTQALLRCMGARAVGAERWLIISNQDGRAPFQTIRQVCVALCASRVFQRILLEEPQGARVL